MMGVPKFVELNDVESLGKVGYFSSRQISIDTVEVSMLREQSGATTTMVISLASMLELVDQCSKLINSYSVSKLKDIGLL